jgi:hypothetical protein
MKSLIKEYGRGKKRLGYTVQEYGNIHSKNYFPTIYLKTEIELIFLTSKMLNKSQGGDAFKFVLPPSLEKFILDVDLLKRQAHNCRGDNMR